MERIRLIDTCGAVSGKGAFSRNFLLESGDLGPPCNGVFYISESLRHDCIHPNFVLIADRRNISSLEASGEWECLFSGLSACIVAGLEVDVLDFSLKGRTRAIVCIFATKCLASAGAERARAAIGAFPALGAMLMECDLMDLGLPGLKEVGCDAVRDMHEAGLMRLMYGADALLDRGISLAHFLGEYRICSTPEEGFVQVSSIDFKLKFSLERELFLNFF